MRKLKIAMFGGLCLFALVNLGIKLYTRDPGPMVDNYPLSCVITAGIAMYFGLETIRVWRYDA